jgi:hypothetical protein
MRGQNSIENVTNQLHYRQVLALAISTKTVFFAASPSRKEGDRSPYIARHGVGSNIRDWLLVDDQGNNILAF